MSRGVPLAGLPGAVTVAALGVDAEEESADSQALLFQIASQYTKGWGGWGDVSVSFQGDDGPGPGGAEGTRPASPAPEPSDEVEFLVDADDEVTLGKAPGLAYRVTKRLYDRNDDRELVRWGTTVRGVDRGDGWLRVGDHYLPMSVNGVAVVHPRKPLAEIAAEEEEDPNADPVDQLFRRAERKVEESERARAELAERTRQALRSSATWRRRYPGDVPVAEAPAEMAPVAEEDEWGS